MVERKQLRVDPARRLHGAKPRLAQYVRANDEQGYGETVAVEELDKESFLIWVHSRDSRVFVEDCMGHVLGYGALHFKSPLGAYPGPVPALDPIADEETPEPDAGFVDRLAGLLLDDTYACFEIDIFARLVKIYSTDPAEWTRVEGMLRARDPRLSRGVVSQIKARISSQPALDAIRKGSTP